MRGRRLVTTERIVAIVSEDGQEVLAEVDEWANENGLYLDSVTVGEPIERVVDEGAATIGVTIGGDGTFLEGVKAFAPMEIPLLGVDVGTRPFLVRVEPADVREALGEIVRGHATIESRSQLRVRAGDLDVTGLNDVALEHVSPPDPVDRKITSMDVFVGDEYAGAYPGTGVAISTPTGSTGLALSAGGPIHYPRKNRTLQITPLLTHDIGVRPVVVDEGVPIIIEPRGGVVLDVDGGRHHRELGADVPIRIELADHSAELIHTSVEGSFFEALTDRLGWNLRRGEPPPLPAHVLPTETPDGVLEHAQAVAEEAAQSVGGPLRELHGRTESVEYKTDKADVVTEADYQSERIISTILESEFPGHNIHSEEDVRHESGSRFTWLVDPLDGTGNYANGNPNYAVSIALVRDDEPVVGVV
ncbi:MAG: inositol monophosphatase family protein, partial [Halobacteriota archaeon]